MPSKRILLADDSVTALTMHRMILAGAGYDLLTAQDGQEAIELATAERPDLILMDVVMPRKTGFEATRILRKQEATKADPRDHGHHARGAEDLEICFQCGCNDYINKPVDGAVLLAKVRRHPGELRPPWACAWNPRKSAWSGWSSRSTCGATRTITKAVREQVLRQRLDEQLANNRRCVEQLAARSSVSATWRSSRRPCGSCMKPRCRRTC